MNVYYMSQSILGTKQANCIHVMNMCTSIANLGHSVKLFAIGDRSDLDNNPYSQYGVSENFEIILSRMPVLFGLGSFFYGLVSSIKLLYHVRSKSSKRVIYCRCIYTALILLFLRYNICIELHALPHRSFLKLIYAFILRNNKVDSIVVISNSLKSDMVSNFKVNHGSRIIVAHDAAKLNTMLDSSEVKIFKSARSKKITVGYAGGLRTGNGIDIIIALAQRNPDFNFEVVGGTPNEIEYWSKHMGGSEIKWYGRVDPVKVYSFLFSCDVLIAPYQVGPKTASGVDTLKWMSPLKIFEYMSARKPMIVSDFPVLREVLDSNCCVFADPNHIESWDIALHRIVDHPEFGIDIANRAYFRFQNFYTWDSRAKLIFNELEG